ncbi:MAG: tetratricopeptide repeat protein [Bacteroidales bacterium]|nr:tetratricopeptide repeat protein [Bacteroidales bacterium]MCF8458544.1 tetratricopeptide repeat protein [Bacteroidales bacterium]
MSAKGKKQAHKQAGQKPTSEKTEIIKSKIPVRFGLIVILIATLIAYSPVFKAGFTNWDDQGYVTENPVVQQLNAENFKLLLTEDFVANYHPLTMISLAVDYAIAGDSATWYHLINLILHLLNTFLVFYLVWMIFKKLELSYFSEMALVVAALFGLHTLHVESVAWIAERKDVLYTLFFLASLIAWMKYLNSGKWKFYTFALILFIFSCFSKGQAVSLAALLFAFDFLFKRKILSGKVMLEKIPFLALAVVFGIFALNAQQEGEAVAGFTQEHVSLFERLMFASYGYVMYHLKLILPINLSAIYPYPPKMDGSFPVVYYIFVIPALAIVASIFYFLKKDRIVAFTLLFFLINVALVLQIIPVGSAIMADRYVYIPSIGFFMLIAVLLSRFLKKRSSSFLVVNSAGAGILVVLAGMTYSRAQVWNNSMSLWNDVLSKHKTVQLAWNNRGNLKYDAGDLQGAMADYSETIKIQDRHPEAYMNRGTVKHDLNDFQGSLADYNKAIEIDPNHAKSYYGRGGTYLAMNQFKAAIQDYDKAIELDPNYAAAYSNRGNAKMNQKLLTEAMQDYNKAIELNPNFSDAYSNRGIAWVVSGNFDAAIKDYSMAIKLKPNDGLSLYLRGLAYISQGNRQMACFDFNTSAKLGFQGAAQKVMEYCQ